MAGGQRCLIAAAGPPAKAPLCEHTLAAINTTITRNFNYTQMTDISRGKSPMAAGISPSPAAPACGTRGQDSSAQPWGTRRCLGDANHSTRHPVPSTTGPCTGRGAVEGSLTPGSTPLQPCPSSCLTKHQQQAKTKGLLSPGGVIMLGSSGFPGPPPLPDFLSA